MNQEQIPTSIIVVLLLISPLGWIAIATLFEGMVEVIKALKNKK